MNQPLLQVIKNEIEKIEQSSGFGSVTINIKDGGRYQIESTHSVLIDCQKKALDSAYKKE